MIGGLFEGVGFRGVTEVVGEKGSGGTGIWAMGLRACSSRLS